ncbi:MAG: CPBP family intramembrane glutamic endopeptidase [Gammaproteobacteria bacterium]
MQSKSVTLLLKAFAFWGLFELGMMALSFVPASLPIWLTGLAFGALVSAFAYLLSLVFVRFDSLTLDSLGMTYDRASLPKLSISLLGGMAVMGVFYVVFLIFTPLSYAINPEFTLFRGVFLSCLSFIALSAMEEVAFRGYFLKKLQGSVGTRAAIYITSICFGMYHGLNFESIVGPAIWGLTFAVMALWSRGLAIPIGFHAGVNYLPAMLGEKPRYAEAVWISSVPDASAVAAIQSIGMILQGVVLVIGVFLVELYIKREKAAR